MGRRKSQFRAAKRNEPDGLARTAYHEAGHALAAWRVGITLSHVGISGADSGWMDPIGLEDGSADTIMKAVYVYVAGGVAQAIFDGNVQRAVSNNHSDLEHAAELLAFIEPDEAKRPGLQMEIWQDVEQKLRADWPCVDAVAKELLVRGRLTGAEAYAIMDGVIRDRVK